MESGTGIRGAGEPGRDRPSRRERRILRRSLPACILIAACAGLLLAGTPVLSGPVDVAKIEANIAPLRIAHIAVDEISPSGARISWVTDNPSDSWVYYDTTSHRNPEEYAWHAGTEVLSVTHQVTLSRLNPATLYYYRVVSRGPGGIVVVSGERVFRTLTLPPAGGGGGGGGAYGGIFSVIPFAPPTTAVPSPPATPPPLPPPGETGAGNITGDNWSPGIPPQPTGTPCAAITGGGPLPPPPCLAWILVAGVISLGLVLLLLFSRRRKEEGN
ncbi:MAG: fibronectin type III domain-containing protein [Methanolinea sp.]|nr:fibronectin type III domain-containing protein [Methanolinea sp.]